MQADKKAGERFYAVFSDRLRQLRTARDMPWTRISALTGLDIRDLIRMEEGRPFHYSTYRRFMDGLDLTFAELSPMGIYPTAPFPDTGNAKWAGNVARLLETLTPSLPGIAKCHDDVELFRKHHDMLDDAEKETLTRKTELIELGRYLNICCMLRGIEMSDLHDKLELKVHTLVLLSRGFRDPSMGTLALIGSCLGAPIDCIAPTKALPDGRFARGLIAYYIQTLSDLTGHVARISELTGQIQTLMFGSRPFGPLCAE